LSFHKKVKRKNQERVRTEQTHLPTALPTDDGWEDEAYHDDERSG